MKTQIKRRGFLGALAAFPALGVARKAEKPPENPALRQPCLVCSKTGHQMQHGYLRPKWGELVYRGGPVLVVWCENKPVNWDWYVYDSRIEGLGRSEEEDED